MVHTCSLGAILSPGAEDVRRLLERLRPSATVSYDINVKQAVARRAEVVRAVEEVVMLSDLVKASDEDLEALYPDDTVEQSVARLLGLGPSAVVVTRGRDGATWFHADGPGRRARRPTSRWPTPSAPGTPSAPRCWTRSRDLDAFGGRLAALDASDIETVLRRAARAAAVTVSRPGADPPYRHEVL